MKEHNDCHCDLCMGVRLEQRLKKQGQYSARTEERCIQVGRIARLAERQGWLITSSEPWEPCAVESDSLTIKEFIRPGNNCMTIHWEEKHLHVAFF